MARRIDKVQRIGIGNRVAPAVNNRKMRGLRRFTGGPKSRLDTAADASIASRVNDPNRMRNIFKMEPPLLKLSLPGIIEL